MSANKGFLAGLLVQLKCTPQSITRESAFNDRLRMQKAVYLLKHLGVEPFKSYSFSMYLRGPYSSQLAKDYYALSGVAPVSPPVEPDKLGTLTWFLGHNSNWLEVASSILSIKEKYGNLPKGETYDTLRMSKPWVSARLFEEIVSELEHKGL